LSAHRPPLTPNGTNIGAALTPFSDQGSATSLRSFPGQISQRFSAGTTSRPRSRWSRRIAFALVLVALVVRTWRGGDWIVNAGWAMLALLLALPGHAVVPGVAVALRRARPRRRLRAARAHPDGVPAGVRMPYPPF